MSPEIGKAATRIALFLIVAAGLSLLWVRRDSAEFVVLVLTIGMGLLLLGAVALFARAGQAPWRDRPPAGREEEPPPPGPGRDKPGQGGDV